MKCVPSFPFLEIKGRVWKTHTVSPLFGYDPQISISQLTQFFKTHLRHSRDDFSISIQKGLRGNREDADALKIQAQNSTIYFIAINATEFDLKSQNIGNLPLALSTGPDEKVQEVFLKMEQFFDCVINPLQFEPTDLKWMSALWGATAFDDENPNEKKDMVKLRYRLPMLKVECEGLDTVDVKFTGEQMRELWPKYAVAY